MFGNWTPPHNDGKIRHKIVVTKDEIEKDDRTLSQYLVWRACEKANRLGLENYKVLEVTYKQDGEDWDITFVTEKDWK